MTIVMMPDPARRSVCCRAILSGLPEWFGRPDAIDAYVAAASNLTTVAWLADDRAVGFACLRRETPDAFDIHVMAVDRAYHRRGGGRALVDACARHARRAGAAFLTARTLGPTAGNAPYADTRAFYRACGMAEIGAFPNHWTPDAPMLLMGKPI